MALIPTFTPVVAGTPPTPGAAAAGDTAPVGEGLVLVVENTSGSPITATVVVPGNLATGDAFPDKAYTVPATTGKQWIPLLPVYADPADGLAHVNYSATAGVTRYVVRF